MASSVDWEDSNRRIAREGAAILERTAESLASSHRVAIETEEVGASVVSDLHQQRETLLRSKQRLDDTDMNLANSRGVLRRMACNVIANKLILIVIIVLELCILPAVIYLKHFRH